MDALQVSTVTFPKEIATLQLMVDNMQSVIAAPGSSTRAQKNLASYRVELPSAEHELRLKRGALVENTRLFETQSKRAFLLNILPIYLTVIDTSHDT